MQPLVRYAGTLALVVVAVLAGTSACRAQTGAAVVVTSQPSQAKVFVNGYYKGTTPITVTIDSATAQPREYLFTVLTPGFEKWASKYSITAGTRNEVHAVLQPLPLELAGKTICIDPGHPSETSPGTKGRLITENRANWLVALKLKALLEQMGARVVMTKSSENEMVTNRRRAEIANAANADLMIRLHCDAAPSPGLAVFYPDRQGTTAGVTGPSQSVRERSRRAAQAFYPAVMAALQGEIRGRGIKGDSATYVGGRQGALTGSIFSQVPVLTVEMVVLTIPSDEAFIAAERGQNMMAAALAKGIAAAVAK